MSADTTEFDYAEAWVPAVGDVIRGKVTEVSSRSGEYGDYPIVTLKTDDGEIAVHGFHTALRNQFAELNVQSGDSIGIMYRGRVKNRAGDREFESYRVKQMNGTGSAFDWNAEKRAALEDPTPDERPSAPLDAGEGDSPF
ncbi:MAG: hypothetical protein AABM43_01745 [Actinomycetota bacterium]